MSWLPSRWHIENFVACRKVAAGPSGANVYDQISKSLASSDQECMSVDKLSWPLITMKTDECSDTVVRTSAILKLFNISATKSYARLGS